MKLTSAFASAAVSHVNATPVSFRTPGAAHKPLGSVRFRISVGARLRLVRSTPTGHIVTSRESPLPANIDTDAPKTFSSSRRALIEILAGAYQLALPLWNGRRKTVAWLWTLATITLALLATLYAVLLSMIQKFFWNCLNTKDTAKFGQLLFLYCVAVTIGPIVVSMFEWVKQRLALMWRQSLTEHLMSRYFTGLNYYKLSLDGTFIDNPDQRISEDVMKFTSRAVRFFTITGVAIFDLLIFSVILYKVYSPLLYALIVYSATGTLFIGYAGRRLLRLNRMQVTREADFRFGLVRVRETTEAVAFYNGEDAEKRELLKRFGAAFRNNLSLLGLKRNVDYLSSSFRYWVQVVPTAVIAPQYFAGNVALGTLSQVYFSFNHVLSSLGLVVSEFSALAEFGAGVRRLKGLADTLQSDSTTSSSNVITTKILSDDKPAKVNLLSVSVRTPSTPPRRLVQNLSLEVSAGERLLVVGRSGIGKSSLLRVICGLWDTGAGYVTRPSKARTLFLPQRPFIMLGTLKENVLYPGQKENVKSEDVEAAMRRVNLGYLLTGTGGLEASGETLTRRLSLGEQQRLAFARILISRPSLVILDESTSALDLENEREMYKIISDLGITCVSVGNRPSLLDFHDRVLHLEAEGKWIIEKTEVVERRRHDLWHD